MKFRQKSQFVDLIANYTLKKFALVIKAVYSLYNILTEDESNNLKEGGNIFLRHQ